MSARQLIVLVVAAIAAIGALFLIRGMGGQQEAEPAAKAEPVAGEQVLIITRDVPQGSALKPEDLAWRVFPTASVSDRFVRASQQPSAQTEFAGAVTRQAFMQGAPLIAAQVVKPGEGGFMAASLTPGMRAVAIEVKPETSVGGYVQPNDRVDIILTTERDVNSPGGSYKEVSSEAVIEDVRVLALDDLVQAQANTQDAPERVTAVTVVLEMSAEDARLLAQAEGQGDLSLSLRGIEAETAALQTPSSRRNGRQGSVRIHAFGVSSGGGR